MENASDRHIQWIRHGEVMEKGRLFGRVDADIAPIDDARAAALRPFLWDCGRVFSSPLKRARETAEMFFARDVIEMREGLVEQDFGVYDGGRFEGMPDLGEMSGAALAAYRPQGGESFLEVCARVRTALAALPGGRSVVFAHAGVIRAAIGIALGAPEKGLAFEIDNLSLSETRHFGGRGAGAVVRVNVVGQS